MAEEIGAFEQEMVQLVKCLPTKALALKTLASMMDSTTRAQTALFEAQQAYRACPCRFHDEQIMYARGEYNESRKYELAWERGIRLNDWSNE